MKRKNISFDEKLEKNAKKVNGNIKQHSVL